MWKKAYKLVIVTALVAALVIGGVWSLDRLFPPALERLENLSSVVEGENGDVLRMFSTPEGLLRVKTQASEIDPKYLLFLKSYEDKRFGGHVGVDPLALIRALWQWMKNGEIVSGGSTLTMQVARLLEPRPRTFRSKLIEMARSLQLEWHFSKEEILDIYVTLAPFGGRVEGVKGASFVYFRKKPSHLTIAEAALLTVLPQSPSRLRPDQFPEKARNARNKVLSRLLTLQVIDRAQYDEALAEPIPVRQYSVPMLAPHFGENLVQERAHEQRFFTTINALLQAEVQSLAQTYSASIGPTVSTGVLVIENEGRKVRTYVGSNNYVDRQSAGFIDMTHAVRSPGSTLKPFIYGLSFDAGQTHPQTLIWDSPLSDTGYRPSNFDKVVHGQVSVADALRYSLNIPAVKVLGFYGPIRFSETLRKNGVVLRLPNKDASPNLAISLGGVGVTLEELAMLYRAIAHDRKVCPLVYEGGQGKTDCENTTDIVSAQTQKWISGILQNTLRPEGYKVSPTIDQQKIAFKTGTSYGYRDAWAIGFNPDYTVAVWLGDASGRSIAGMTGLNSAAPLLFSIFEKLPLNKKPIVQSVGLEWKKPAPQTLKIFRKDYDINVASASTTPLTITYPIEESAFLLSDIVEKGVVLQAQNGKRPLTWMINGTPLYSDKWRRNAKWVPEGPGFYKITVLDQNAKAASRFVEVR